MTPGLPKVHEPSDAEISEAEIPEEIRRLPKELGILLLVAGVVGLIVPGPMGTPALLAGGVVLWPGASDKVAGWLKRRHPAVYVQSIGQIHRFLDDMERRYPSTKK